MALTRADFLLRQFTRKLWVRAAAFAVLGAAAAAAGRVIGPWLPADLIERSGADSVSGLLNILATSMLAVTTFSLSIMVSAYSAAAAAVSPRAVDLLLEDRTSQTVLSTFLGAFLFALVGLIALEAGLYGDSGRVVLFFATIAVTVAVVFAILRWISHLTTFGRVGDTTQRVEKAAANALRLRLDRPCLGGTTMPEGGPPDGLVPLLSPATGYLRHIDMPHLSEIADRLGAQQGGAPAVWLSVLPGAFVHPSTPLLWHAPVVRAHDTQGEPASRSGEDAAGQGDNTDLTQDLCAAFTIGATRTFDQDPRFGLCVLTEIAARALSPAVNDPGTAIDVLGRVVRVLGDWPDRATIAPEFPLVAVPPLRLEDVFDDVFPTIAHDGAAMASVQIRLQKALLALAERDPASFAAPAAHHSRRALADAQAHLIHKEDLDRLEDLSARIGAMSRKTDGHSRAL